MPPALSTLGIAHTLFSIVAIASAIAAVASAGGIDPRRTAGRVYLIATVLTAATALVIFQRGGFNAGHALAILTLGAVGVGLLATYTAAFGRLSPYLSTTAFSATFLFHAVPGVTETLTRLPPGAPVFTSIEAPEFKPIYGTLLALFIVWLVIQLRRLRGRQQA